MPSISLVQQNLREWGRHAQEDFDCLVVCSDESVASDRDDPALRHIAELGIDVTTAPADITAFLAKRRRRPAVVIATYQSSDRVSGGQEVRCRKKFDLALCDESTGSWAICGASLRPYWMTQRFDSPSPAVYDGDSSVLHTAGKGSGG